MYAPLAAWFKAKHPICECCKQNPTEDIHHSHGKIGALFFFTPWFKPVCRECHNWIEANKEKARAIGFECQPGEFNTQAPLSMYLLKFRNGRTVQRDYFPILPEHAEKIGDNFRRQQPGVNYEVTLIE